MIRVLGTRVRSVWIYSEHFFSNLRKFSQLLDKCEKKIKLSRCPWIYLPELFKKCLLKYVFGSRIGSIWSSVMIQNLNLMEWIAFCTFAVVEGYEVVMKSTKPANVPPLGSRSGIGLVYMDYFIIILFGWHNHFISGLFFSWH